jgi:uncharacterized membrane protein (DUF2068 family)
LADRKLSTRAEALRAIAIFEALKGAAVIVAGFGLLGLLHQDVRHVATELVDFLHLSHEGRYGHFFLAAADRLGDAHLMTIAAVAVLYVAVRFTEAYGLWFGRRWAEWFAAASGAIYIPFEVRHIRPGHVAIPLAVLALNIAIIAFMLYSLYAKRRAAGVEPRP